MMSLRSATPTARQRTVLTGALSAAPPARREGSPGGGGGGAGAAKRRVNLHAVNGHRQRGFTLLEVFVATAILGITIIYMFDALTHSPDRSNRAKLETVATMLARTKMIDLEAGLLKDGWENFDDEECGDFTDDEYGGVARFQWCAQVEKIELPDTVNVEAAVGKMLGISDDSDDPAGGGGMGQASNLLGAWMGGAGGLPGAGGSAAGGGPTQENPAMSGLASILSSFLAPFRNVVEQAIRRITLRVFWKYRGREEEVKLIYYVTRAELVEQAIIGGFLQSASQPSGSTPTTKGKTK
ncbi:MAG: type II secretion system protein [bacterium]